MKKDYTILWYMGSENAGEQLIQADNYSDAVETASRLNSEHTDGNFGFHVVIAA